jgi:hypothetical protein
MLSRMMMVMIVGDDGRLLRLLESRCIRPRGRRRNVGRRREGWSSSIGSRGGVGVMCGVEVGERGKALLPLLLLLLLGIRMWMWRWICSYTHFLKQEVRGFLRIYH